MRLHILVTRPDPAGAELCARIHAAGDHAIHFPTIAFASPSDEALFAQSVALLGEQDWLIFMSPQAVYASIATIRKMWPIFPSTIKWAAVGAGTAKALREAGYAVTVCPDLWNSEGLLALPAFQSVTGCKIALIRGEGGRDMLAQTLARRGAKILPVLAYRRMLPEYDPHFFTDWHDKQIDIIVCASFESVHNLKQLVGRKLWPHLQVIPLIVVSERIKMLAERLNFQTIWVARNANHTAILEMITQKRNELCQIKQMK